MANVVVFTIATNKYFEYWKKMITSADRYLFLYDDITFHVFTNFGPQSFNNELKRVKIVFHKIPDLKGPKATLYRYRYIYEYGMKLESDYFVHIDADMLIVPHDSKPISSLLEQEEVGLVEHPGYWRVKNKKSKAFVSRVHRKKYFCGAVWFGKKDAILKLAYELATFTDLDLEWSYIPSWNDESYLNYWATKNRFKHLDPSFCYDESYKNLDYLNPKIIALDKTKL